MAVTDAGSFPTGPGRRSARDEERSGSGIPLLTWEWRTSVVGLVATAVAFGPARMAYGMLLPSIRETFALSSSTAGAIASASFVAFAAALVCASVATRIVGAKLPVVVGGAFALAGAVSVTFAASTALLIAGVVLAAASAGLCWTPFNAVAGRLVRARRRDRVLSTVSTGTTLGIALMALGALALAWTGASWRIIWGATALSGALVVALAYYLLPPSRRLLPRQPSDVPTLDVRETSRRLCKRSARPLYALAFAFGMSTAIFSTFAVDHLAVAGTSEEAGEKNAALIIGGLIFLAYGILGAVGFLTDTIERLIGLRGTAALCAVAAMLGAASLAFAPANWTLALAGSGLVGASVMVFSVLLSIAGLRLFPALPVMGFTVAVIAVSLGSVVGPALAGSLADAYGTGMALWTAAGVAGLALLVVPAVRTDPDHAS